MTNVSAGQSTSFGCDHRTWCACASPLHPAPDRTLVSSVCCPSGPTNVCTTIPRGCSSKHTLRALACLVVRTSEARFHCADSKPTVLQTSAACRTCTVVLATRLQYSHTGFARPRAHHRALQRDIFAARALVTASVDARPYRRCMSDALRQTRVVHSSTQCTPCSAVVLRRLFTAVQARPDLGVKPP